MTDVCAQCGVVEAGPYCPVHGVVHREFKIAGRYDVDELLAASAAAFVFSAKDRGREVAIKILRSDKADTGWASATPVPFDRSSRESQREFQRAAATMAGLPDQYASEILNVGRDDKLGLTFVVINRQGAEAAALEARSWMDGTPLDFQNTATMDAVLPALDPSIEAELELAPPPQMIGSYRVVRELGAGATGVVYLCEHPVIHSKVAIKVLLPEIARQRDIVERFMQEARASSQIGSPHIPQYFDFGTTPGGQPYAVMEYFEGETLGHRLFRERTLSVDDTAQIIDQVASAMQMAHDAGLIHRDLKPENILLVAASSASRTRTFHGTATLPDLRPPGVPRIEVRLLDFGIAKVVGRRSATQTQSGAFLGTPFYCAPEQVFGHEVDARTDVYSLGATAFEMLTGQPPFIGEVPEILSAKATESPPDPRKWGVADAVADTILKMLARDPAQRAPSMAWVRERLARWNDRGGERASQPALLVDGASGRHTMLGTGPHRREDARQDSARLARATTANATADDAAASGSGAMTGAHDTVAMLDDALATRGRGKRAWWLAGGVLAAGAAAVALVFSGVLGASAADNQQPTVVPAPMVVPAPTPPVPAPAPAPVEPAPTEAVQPRQPAQPSQPAVAPPAATQPATAASHAGHPAGRPGAATTAAPKHAANGGDSAAGHTVKHSPDSKSDSKPEKEKKEVLIVDPFSQGK